MAHSTKQRITSRPHFLNPFNSWRDEDARELHRLYSRARAEFESSPFSDESFLKASINEITTLLCEGTGYRTEDALIVRMATVTEALLAESCFSFPTMSDDKWAALNVKSANTLRITLEQKLAFLSDWEAQIALAIQVLVDLWCGILKAIPGDTTTRDTSSWTFNSNCISRLKNPHETLTALLTHFLSNHVIQEKGLFTPLCQQLYRNALEASGVLVDPDKPLLSHDTERPVFPDDYRNEMATDVAKRYFKDTPLLDVLDAPLSLPVPDTYRFEHCHILGGTGHGKTQCLQYLLLHDLVRALQNPISIVVIDSQGDLIRKLSSSVLFNPDSDASLANRFVMIDPAEIEHPPALNLFDPGLERLESYTPHQRELAFNSLVDIYGRFFGSLLGADLTTRQSTVFRYLARLMLTIEGATIHTLIELMDDITPFKEAIEKLDPTARRFFEKEFSRKSFLGTRQQIKQRLYAVLSIPTFDRLFSAPKSKINLFDALNEGKIVLVNTAKDLLKADGAAIFGRFILALLEHAVMERATLAENKRNPVFLYVDEAQDYFDDTIETLLVQARKYNCGLTLAHQSLAQLSLRLRAIFLGNTTIKLAGGLSNSDARDMAPDMRATPEFLLSMKKEDASTEFALSVRNHTSRALTVNVPLGFLESQPVLEAPQLERLLQRNREAIGYTSTGQPDKKNSAPPSSSEFPDEPPQSVHRELQKRIKQTAQQRGLAAEIEQEVLDGRGRVDVVLEQEGLRIAVEVSVTTKVEDELRNVEKCLSAGFEAVWVTSPDPEHLKKLQDGLEAVLPSSELAQVSFLVEHDLYRKLREFPCGPTNEALTSHSKVFGYNVVTHHIELPPDQTADRRHRLTLALENAAHHA